MTEGQEQVAAPPAPPRARRRLFHVIAPLVSIAFALVIGEIVVRLRFGSIEPSSYFVPGIYAQEPSPMLWSCAPGYSGVAVEQMARLSTHTNELGMRDPPLTPQRASAKTRVLFIGDSITFGGGVADGEPFPSVAERLWAAKRPGVATFNAGVPGYDTVQERAMLERVGPRVKPHLVIVTWYRNDVWTPSEDTGVKVIEGYLVRDEEELRSWKRRTLEHRHPIEWSALYRFLRIEWNNLRTQRKTQSRADEFKDGGRDADPQLVQRSKDALAAMQEWCRVNAAKLLVVLSPAREESEVDSVQEPRLIKSMADFCREKSIAVRSLQPAAHEHWEQTRESLFLTADRCHYGARGHEWVARQIVDAAEPLLCERGGNQ